ncbi:MAG: ATP-binding protein, partial [Thermodesulfobacteriota bacterium]|nr:ATP-binding protein [Thermodesulfobacteriota bacterium]
STDAIYITAQDGKFVDFNKSMLDLLGYAGEEMMGLKAQDTYAHPRDRNRFQKEIEKKGFVRDYELNLCKKDGVEIDCLITATVRRADDGSILWYYGIIRDITEKKRAQKEKMQIEIQLRQAQKMEAIGTLAGGIAHDFNNILAAVIGYAGLAKMRVPEDSKVLTDLDQILKSGNRAKTLIQQILAFSRKQELEQRPLQLKYIVKETLNLLRATLPTDIEIKDDIAKDAGIVNADPTQMQQVIMNLCTNAGHAMQEEGGVLAVGLANVELDDIAAAQYLDMSPGRYLRLTVSDTGYGMTPDVNDRIFEPYFTTKEKGVGTGLGLSVVKGIVDSHGGTITVYSEPGKGSTFHVYLPLIQEEVIMPEMDEQAPVPTGNERIIFVDDEKALVDSGKQTLEQLGYKVTTMTSSIEALELFRNNPDKFDLVITDMTMPRMTGDKLAGELMKIRTDIPVIICTGFSKRISEEKAREMGIKGLAMKPLVMRDLAEAVRKALD